MDTYLAMEGPQWFNESNSDDLGFAYLEKPFPYNMINDSDLFEVSREGMYRARFRVTCGRPVEGTCRQNGFLITEGEPRKF